MRVIDKIAQLILEDPYITAKNIARKLGYAEEKTVYYWIDKEHYKGLTAFKRAVLQGQHQAFTVKATEPPARYGKLPVVHEFSPDGRPILSGETLAVPSAGKVQWVWRYPGPPLPTFLPGDLLLLRPFSPDLHLPWGVGRADTGQMEIRALTYPDGQAVALYPLSLAVDRTILIRYAITQLIRKF